MELTDKRKYTICIYYKWYNGIFRFCMSKYRICCFLIRNRSKFCYTFMDKLCYNNRTVISQKGTLLCLIVHMIRMIPILPTLFGIPLTALTVLFKVPAALTDWVHMKYRTIRLLILKAKTSIPFCRTEILHLRALHSRTAAMIRTLAVDPTLRPTMAH